MKTQWLMIAIAGLLLTGCASVDVCKTLNNQQLTTTGEKNIAHLHGDIYGYYLFGLWPLFTGDPADSKRIAWFKDTVTEEAAVDMLTKKSMELGATKTTDLTSKTDSTGLNTLFLVWYYDVQASGNAVK
ncbi:MAG: hypothetical protein WCL16_10720 [bacterium]